MPGLEFSIGPGHPPATPVDLPNFILFRANGTDLGGRDATILNFGANLTATRGVGENADKVTVTGQASGEGGSLPVPWSGLYRVPSGPVFFGGDVVFNAWELIQELLPSPDLELVGSDLVNILTPGVYEIRINAFVTPTEGQWPSTSTVVGTRVEGAIEQVPTRHEVVPVSGFQYYRDRCWVDTFSIVVAEVDVPFKLDPYMVIGIYSDSITGTVEMTVAARRIGDVPA